MLVAPRREMVVDGQSVTFEWQPVPDARSHRLEVAADSQFDQVLLEVDVTGRDSITLLDSFGTEGDTYYWRIIVEDEDGHIHGEDTVESFVGGTSEEAVQHVDEVTGGEAEFGLVSELFKGAAVEMAAEVTQDDAYFRKEVELGVAHEGVAAGQILAITGGIVLALVLIIVTLIQYTQVTTQEVRYSTVGMSGYPELREARNAALRKLSEYGTVEDQPGVYRIPIDRAIELIANETYQQQGRTYSAELPLDTQDRTNQ